MADALDVVDTPSSGDLTLDNVKDVVEGAFKSSSDATNQKYDALERQIVVLGDSVALLTSAEDSKSEGESVTLVRLVPEQVDKAMAGFRILTTEGLILIILLALQCGLTAYHIFSGRWGYHG